MKFCHMKVLLALLLLSSYVVTLAAEDDPCLIFPPFAKTDVAKLDHPIPRSPSYEELQSISVEELRGIMVNGDAFDQRTVTKELLERGDRLTVLRLVYSLKQGNVGAIQMLRASTLAAIPYLMEDVAQGSLAYYGSYDFGDAFTSSGNVREAAVECVTTILLRAPEITGETKDYLLSIGRGRSDQIQTLSDKSKYLLQWWLLNEGAFEAGKWEDLRPLSQEIIYPDPSKDPYFLRDKSWDPKKQPPFGSPMWELPESFEAWAERIVDPQRRNLDFVALSWDGTKVVEHPPKSLDPRTGKGSPQERDPRRTPAPSDLSEQDSSKVGGSWKGTSWAALAAALILVFSLVQWVRHKSNS
ncbi:MAG: hypothetical protein RLZZ214_4261 [Verrucomicrobiota bacterium]|jgi:hypothetical protein